MTIEMILQDSKEGKLYDISELVEAITYETSMLNQPGKLTFNFLPDAKVPINEGSSISLKVNGAGVFFGFIFRHGRSEDREVGVVAYDQLRYLKNKDTYVTSNQTASQIFTKVCTDFRLKYRVVDAASYVVPPRVNDNKTLFEVIQQALDATLINTAKWFMIRDNFGVLEFVDIAKLKTTFYIGDGYKLLSFAFDSSIDQDTYNQVKLIKNNKDTAKREVYIVKDSATIKQWGTLQYFETMDESANEAQIKSRAEQLLKLKNRVTRKVKLLALGEIAIRAGNGIVVGIEDLVAEDIPYNKYFLVTACTHKFENDMHTMQLELQVIE